MRIIVYGAKSLAVGMATAIKELYGMCELLCFAVTSAEDNPKSLLGLPVIEIGILAKSIKEKENVNVLICTPEDVHPQIRETLEQHGFYKFVCMDSVKESVLMEQYFEKTGKFKSIHSLWAGRKKTSIQVFSARSHNDRELNNQYGKPEWLRDIQVGADLAESRICRYRDNIGENISYKNVNYCELTALYWVWRNLLSGSAMECGGNEENEEKKEYYGLFHYRRRLDIRDDDLLRLGSNHVDAVLQFPTIHEPDIGEHHMRYIQNRDWDAVRYALEELQPEYAGAFPDILKQPYFYNYNMVVAKREVLGHYCSWLFPVLERTEELSNPKGWERADRYIGYIAESLMTLYFLYHREDLRIYHAGRSMLT